MATSSLANRDYHRMGASTSVSSPDADARDLPALLRAAAADSALPLAVMARCSRRRCIAHAYRALFRSVALLVCAVRRPRRSTRPSSRCMLSRSGRWRCITPGARRMPGCVRSMAATGSIWPAPLRGAWFRRRRLGVARQPHRSRQGAGEADGWRQSRHGVDLECHRQALGRLGACRRCAGSQARLPAQSSDRRTAARARRRLSLLYSDPVTGQAAWYDLRVSIEKAGQLTRRPRPRRASSPSWRRPACARLPPLPARGERRQAAIRNGGGGGRAGRGGRRAHAGRRHEGLEARRGLGRRELPPFQRAP